ncbi:MAG: hypothetical protein ACKVG0_03870, partial [Alphaproteobacteria bacterium]
HSMSMFSADLIALTASCAFSQDKPPVAIGTLDKALIANLQIDLGMAERAAAVARNSGFADTKGFRRLQIHGHLSEGV